MNTFNNAVMRLRMKLATLKGELARMSMSDIIGGAPGALFIV